MRLSIKRRRHLRGFHATTHHRVGPINLVLYSDIPARNRIDPCSYHGRTLRRASLQACGFHDEDFHFSRRFKAYCLITLMVDSHHPVRVRSVYEIASFRMRNESIGARVLLARSTIPPTKRRFVYAMDILDSWCEYTIITLFAVRFPKPRMVS